MKNGSMDLCDENLGKRFIIDHKKLEFDKNAGYNLIEIPEKPDRTLSVNEDFFIHDDLFDRIQSNHQDKISFGSLCQMKQMKINLGVKQQRYMMTGSKKRSGVLPKNKLSILFREREKK